MLTSRGPTRDKSYDGVGRQVSRVSVAGEQCRDFFWIDVIKSEEMVKASHIVEDINEAGYFALVLFMLMVVAKLLIAC